MEDKDVKRLEDRIEAVNREGQLRLDTAMERIEGKFALSAASALSIQGEIAGLRTNVGGVRTILLSVIIPLIIASAIGLGALIVGMTQVWEMGVQTGQAIQANPQIAPKPR